MEERVGRNLIAINELSKAYSSQYEDAPIIVENIPEYSEIIERGLGEYLNPLK